MPAFTGAALLLFANALSAFATIEAWENQINYVDATVDQWLSFISEVGLANVHQRRRLLAPGLDRRGGSS